MSFIILFKNNIISLLLLITNISQIISIIMLPNTRAAIKKLASLTRNSNTSNNSYRGKDNDENISDKKYKLKEYRDMYLNSHTHSFDEIKRNNTRSTANIYDTEQYIHNNDSTDYVYPFTDSLSKSIPPNTFTPNKVYDINVCVYRIFHDGNTTPFLQFKLLKKTSSMEMIFPTFKFERTDSGSDQACLTRGNESIMRWFKVYANDIKFKGFIKISDTAANDATDATACYLIYEETITKDRYKTHLQTELKLLKSNENWWWACSHEIFNKGAVLAYPVSYIVKGLFSESPSIMFLFDKNGFTYETPTILYTGYTEGSSLEEIRLLGPRKLTDDNNIGNLNIARRDLNENRMYGTQYYFYEFDDVFRNACYTYNGLKHKYNKIPDPHIFRYAVFLGVTKVILFDTDNTTTHVSIKGANIFHDTKWTVEGFESIFHGKYVSNANRTELSPVFSVFDNTHFTALSCHEVDASTVPSEFSDALYKTVKLL